MPSFEISDAVESAVFVSTPAGDFVVPAKGAVEVPEEVAVELRNLPVVNEVEEPAQSEESDSKDKTSKAKAAAKKETEQ